MMNGSRATGLGKVVVVERRGVALAFDGRLQANEKEELKVVTM